MSDVETKIVYVVYTNTDLTEGRGREYPLLVAETLETAIRLSKKKYVQGTDCPVKEYVAIKHGYTWLAPVNIIPPSEEDIKVAEINNNIKKVVEKAKAAGLTDEEIQVLKKL